MQQEYLFMGYRACMRWTCLGHAMWLCEAATLRVLFDPLLGETYHDGVFAPVPRRHIDVDALRPDVIVVTHQHPDHFDVASLDVLAQQYPQAVVLTADVLVGEVCLQLGFAHVSLLDEWQLLELDGLTLLTTPSFCAVDEWGVMVATADGVVWNQVDTELSVHCRAVIERAAVLLNRPELVEQITLLIARWQPLLQVDALLGHATNFPANRYSRELDRIAECRAVAVIPGAAGSQLTPSGHWLNAFCYPVSVARVVRDVHRRCPGVAVYTAVPGACWDVVCGDVHPVNACDFVEITDDGDARIFHPSSIPPVRDVGSGDAAALRGLISPWVETVLTPKVGTYLQPKGGGCLWLEVFYPDESRDVWTLQITADRVVLLAGGVGDADMINQVTATDLAAVITGQAPWGRALLSGRLRSMGVLYTVDETGLSAVAMPPFFVYLAIGYAAAMERWVKHQVAVCLRQREHAASHGT